MDLEDIDVGDLVEKGGRGVLWFVGVFIVFIYFVLVGFFLSFVTFQGRDVIEITLMLFISAGMFSSLFFLGLYVIAYATQEEKPAVWLFNCIWISFLVGVFMPLLLLL